MLYCHSCGFDVNHDGWNCMNRKSYHQNWITWEKARQLMKEDRWPGSHSGSHKNLYSNGTQTGEQMDWLLGAATDDNSNYNKVMPTYNYILIPTNNNSNDNNHSLDQQSFDSDDNDGNTIVTSNTSSSISSKTATDTTANYHQANTTAAKIVSNDAGIGGASATGTFLMPCTPVKTMKVATNLLEIQLPNGSTIYSTHTCNLDIDWLPEEATEAHIVPDLAHTSLISICQLCDNGCTVTYNKHACKVYYKTI